MPTERHVSLSTVEHVLRQEADRDEYAQIDQIMGRLDDESFESGRWVDHAESNIDKWGNQTIGVLFMALVEELAEVADEILKTAEPGVQQFESNMAMSMIATIRDTGFDMREFLENEFEDEAGNPLPEEEKPVLIYDVETEPVIEELHDMAPLVYQLLWALEDHDA